MAGLCSAGRARSRLRDSPRPATPATERVKAIGTACTVGSGEATFLCAIAGLSAFAGEVGFSADLSVLFGAPSEFTSGLSVGKEEVVERRGVETRARRVEGLCEAVSRSGCVRVAVALGDR